MRVFIFAWMTAIIITNAAVVDFNGVVQQP
jgi:hypothetical protein